MNFENPSPAAGFIDVIRLVFPCNETSGPAGITQASLPHRSMTLNMQGLSKASAPGPMSHFNGTNKQT